MCGGGGERRAARFDATVCRDSARRFATDAPPPSTFKWNTGGVTRQPCSARFVLKTKDFVPGRGRGQAEREESERASGACERERVRLVAGKHLDGHH